MLMTGSIVMFVCMVTVGIIVAKFRHDWPHHTDAGWAAVVLIWIYIGAFGYGWGPASWVLVSEVFPLSIRARGASIGASSNWVNNFAIAFLVPPMFEAWAWGTYIFFAVFLFFGFFWVWFVLPETKVCLLPLPSALVWHTKRGIYFRMRRSKIWTACSRVTLVPRTPRCCSTLSEMLVCWIS